MTPTTPLALLASFEQIDLSAEPSDADGTRCMVRKRLQKIKLTIRFCQFKLRELKDDDEAWSDLCTTKKEASAALRAGETLVRPRPLKNLNHQRQKFLSHYGNLSSSLGQVFLVLAPDLAARAEIAL